MAGPFELAIGKWCEKAGDRADLVVRKVAIDAFGRVIMRSPVGNPDLWVRPAPPGYVGGRFRNNWYVSIGAPSAETNDTPDASGSGSMGRVQGAAPMMQAGQVIFLVNNLPYAIPLENGWSSQAPAGMVGITVTEFQGIVARATGEAKAERP